MKTEEILLVVETILCFVSAITSATLGVYLHVYRSAKLHYRLYIYLCYTLFVGNCVCGIIMLNLLTQFMSKAASLCFQIIQIADSSVSVLYIFAIFLNYLLKSLGKSEEALGLTDTWLNSCFWTFGVLYFILLQCGLYFVNAIGISTVFFCTSFSIGTTVYIVYKQRRSVSLKGEVYTPLISTRNKDKILVFQFRLVVFLFLALAIFTHMILIVVEYTLEVDQSTRDPEHQDMFGRTAFKLSVFLICSLVVFFVLLHLSYSLGVKKFAKNRRLKKQEEIF